MKLQLSVFAENLSNKPTTPDPFVIISLLHPDDGQTMPTILGQTEILYNTTSPQWTKPIIVQNFEFTKSMNVVIAVYDNKAIMTTSNQKKENDIQQGAMIGSVLFELGTVLGSKGNVTIKEMNKDGSSGVLGLRVEEYDTVATAKGMLRIQFRATNLTNKDGMGFGVLAKSDPFYEIQRLRRNRHNINQAMWDPIFCSCVIDNDLNPKWPVSYIPMSALPMLSKEEEKLRIVVYDKDDGDESDLIGDVQVTLKQLLDPTIANRAGFQLQDPKNKKKSAGKLFVLEAAIEGVVDTKESETIATKTVEDSVATMTISTPPPAPAPLPEPEIVTAIPEEDILYEEAVPVEGFATNYQPYSLQPQPTFLDYVTGGCEIRVVIGIDGTASNGNPNEPSSLHYFTNNNTERNSYEQALYYLCTVLSKYDSDQRYPLYGFGIKKNNDASSVVEQCYNLVSDSQDAIGVDGILQHYRKSFRSGIVMSSPRDFSQVILRVGEDATKEFHKGQSYSILLLFTNGSPDDINKTLDAMKQVDDTPLSIVIIGIEDNNKNASVTKADKFKDLFHLEEISRNTHNESSGRRDKLRVVVFNDEMKQDTFHEKLTEAALGHLPDQMIQYFISKAIRPQFPTTTGIYSTSNNSTAANEIIVEAYNPYNDVVVPIRMNQGTGSITVTINVPAPPPTPAHLPTTDQTTITTSTSYNTTTTTNQTTSGTDHAEYTNSNYSTGIEYIEQRPHLKKIVLRGKNWQGKIVQSRAYMNMKNQVERRLMYKGRLMMNEMINKIIT